MPALEIIALDTTTPQLRAPSAADTYTAPRAMDITPVALTGSSATSSLSIAQTWNTTGTPTALSLNVTDTASNAASLLAQFRVGGVSRFSVTKGGQLDAVDIYAGGQLGVAGSRLWGSGVSTTGFLAIGPSNPLTPDTILARDAANTLAQRNGVNAQAFNIYNTYTDASNYERGFVRWSSNVLQIGAEAAGTGSNRVTEIRSSGQLDLFTFGARRVRLSSNGVNIDGSAGSGNLLWITDNANDIGASGASRPRNAFWGGYQEMSEMTTPAAPSANNVRIYAEDNGAGKTRLMALFATGAAQQLAIEP